jgi:putative oxidoreductase
VDGRTEKVIVLLLRVIVGGIFICAGGLKVIDPAQFAKDVDNYRMLPFAATAAVALYLPWLEIIAGAALATGVWQRGASLVIGAMLLAFLIALGTAWARGLDITCGCFGHGPNRTHYPLAMLLDAGLLAALCIANRHPR